MFSQYGVTFWCLYLLLALPASAMPKDAQPKSYPETGKVVALKTAEQPHSTPVYTDPYGKTHGGVSTVRRLPVFRVETATKSYDLEGKRKDVLNLGDTIDFRIDKEWAYVRQGDKEKKFRVVGIELKEGK
jgi:hypothetical protein